MISVLLLVMALAQDRVPVPGEAAQKEAENLVHSVFKEDYAKKTSQERLALARNLLKRGLDPEEEPAPRYVLLREARDVAAKSRDWELAYAATQGICRFFEVDSAQLREAALASWADAAVTVADHLKVVNALLGDAEGNLSAGLSDRAEKEAIQAALLAKKAQAAALAARADALGRKAQDLRLQAEKTTRALETLESRPDDPEANLYLGRMACFSTGTWDAGLPRLAKGSDPVLKALALRDLAAPARADDRTSLGDAWWDLAEKEVASRLRMRERARHWYDLAKPGLSGPAKATVAQRLAELSLDRFPGTWVDITDGRRFGRTERPGDPLVLEPEEGKARRTLFNEPPPGEFDGVTVRMRLPADWTGKGFIEFEDHTKCLSIHRPGRAVVLCTRAKENDVWNVKKQVECPEGPDFVVTVLLREGNYWFYLDGREVGKLPTPAGRITLFNLIADTVPVTFDQIRLHRKE